MSNMRADGGIQLAVNNGACKAHLLGMTREAAHLDSGAGRESNGVIEIAFFRAVHSSELPVIVSPVDQLNADAETAGTLESTRIRRVACNQCFKTRKADHHESPQSISPCFEALVACD